MTDLYSALGLTMSTDPVAVVLSGELMNVLETRGYAMLADASGRPAVMVLDDSWAAANPVPAHPGVITDPAVLQGPGRASEEGLNSFLVAMGRGPAADSVASEARPSAGTGGSSEEAASASGRS